ncbi:MAG: AraC family transcriptional regulator [Capsulimonadaceae bacterium]|nr:AraC family transcriptional regulator [Capsulimonadaceae bacterium]
MRGDPKVIGVGRVRSLLIHPERTLSYWVFAVVTAGTMPVQIGGMQGIARPGEYFLLPPGVRHFGTQESPFDTYWFHFDIKGGAPGTEPAGQADIRLRLIGQMPSEIDYCRWGGWIKQCLDTGTLSLYDVRIQLMAIFGQIMAEDRKRLVASSGDGQIAQRTLEFLLQNFRGSARSDDLSAELGYSYGHIERSFRRRFGMTIRQKLMAIRIDEATSLLQMGMPLKQIAQETGFSDYYYFIRVFTRLVGTSPGRLASRPGRQASLRRRT